MDSIQRLFDCLVGIHQYETAMRCKAQQIFKRPGPDLERLASPACWRRPPGLKRKPRQ